MKKKEFVILIILCFIGIAFWLAANSTLDPDFGWHLRMGQLILDKGIPATDPFSYTMPHYPFVDHEWLTSVIIAFLYNSVGLSGLSIVFAAAAYAAIVLQAVFIKTKWIFIPLMLSSLGLMAPLGLRPQVFSWLLFSVLITVLLKDKLWLRFKYGLPLLILMWVNLHGSFPLGIIMIVIAVLVRAIQKKKISLIDLSIVGFCIAMTFVNPYKERIWLEIWNEVSDKSIYWSFQEWLPAFFVLNYGFIVLFPLSIVLTLKFWKKLSLMEKVYYVVFLLLAFSSNRHIPFWLLIALSLTAKQIEYLYQEVGQEKVRKRFFIAYKIFFIIVLEIAISQFLAVLHKNKYSSLSIYPEKALRFLKTHESKGNIFAEYGWGGYLIWQYPQKKVFIDGRMASWRQNIVFLGESSNALAEYEKVMNGEGSLKTILDRYNIDTVFLNTQEDPEKIVKLFEHIPFMRLTNKASLKRELKKIGMKITYQDGLAIIYQKTK